MPHAEPDQTRGFATATMWRRNKAVAWLVSKDQMASAGGECDGATL